MLSKSPIEEDAEALMCASEEKQEEQEVPQVKVEANVNHTVSQ